LIDCLGEGFAREAGIIFHPESCVDDLIRESGRAKNLRDERIGIEGDGCNQSIKLIGSERSIFLRCRRRSGGLRTAL
jgi:hypothetical protein